MNYEELLKSKSQLGGNYGFDPVFIPDWLYDFQKYLIEWNLKKGRSATFADCGLGKTPMALVWAENIVRKTNKNVIILTPLAVAKQFEREGEKFGIECKRSYGDVLSKITVTNYEKLHLFNSRDFVGVVCDESSTIKNFQGKRQREVVSFMKKIPYRLLMTATPSPNDFIELGTSSEALGELGRMDMLARFFISTEDSLHPSFWGARWRFKKHAEKRFWKWVASWSRAIRKPSDFGFDDGDFRLPRLIEKETIIENSKPLPGMLFAVEAKGLSQQRQELRVTLEDRCNIVSEKVADKDYSVIWCHLNDEGDLLDQIIPESIQVSGSMKDEQKEEYLEAFSQGEIKRLITKPKIAGFGLNWQHCSHQTYFPSHSYEQYYQSVRRCYRFGQLNDVLIDIITTTGQRGVFRNLSRKSGQATKLFEQLVSYMNEAIKIETINNFNTKTKLPKWL